MKKIQVTIVLIYAFIMAYLAILNWQIVGLSLNVNMGFATMEVPFVAGLMFFGLIMLILQWISTASSHSAYEQRLADKNNEIDSLSKDHELSSLRKDNELNVLKASFFEKEAAQVKENSVSLKDLYSQLDQILKLVGSPSENSQQVNELENPEKNLLT